MRHVATVSNHIQNTEYKPLHEENFLSSWLRDDTEGKAEEVDERSGKATEEAKSGKREVEGGILGEPRGESGWVVLSREAGGLCVCDCEVTG